MVLNNAYKDYGYVGEDEIVLDVMRSRDSGNAGFSAFLRKYLNKEVECWSDLKPFFSKKNLRILRKLYKHWEDVELMTGILLEKRYNGVIGRLAATILAVQFYKTRYGDRYFYRNPHSPNPFTKGKKCD